MTHRDDLLLQRPIASADDVAALSSRDRSLLARWLADSTQCDDILLKDNSSAPEGWSRPEGVFALVRARLGTRGVFGSQRRVEHACAIDAYAIKRRGGRDAGKRQCGVEG